MSKLSEKAIEAAARFMEHRGYEILEKGWSSEDGGAIDLVARDDDDTIVFCDVNARCGAEKGLPEEGGEGSRERREIDAAKWLAASDTDLVDLPIRFDTISMLVIGEHRALLRHHINCLGSGSVASSTD